MNRTNLPGYICGALTDLPPHVDGDELRWFYERLADVAEEIMGIRPFVPHEHFDPIKHAGFTPDEIDTNERAQVGERSSYLIVVPIAASWGGGIEVEIARSKDIPAIMMWETGNPLRVSRLLLGNPAFTRAPGQIIRYDDAGEGLVKLDYALAGVSSFHKQVNQGV